MTTVTALDSVRVADLSVGIAGSYCSKLFADAGTVDLATVAGRRARHDKLDGLIAEWTRRRPAEETVARLTEVGIAAGVCWDPRDVTRHPQLAHRHLFETVQHRVVGDHLVPGAPYRFASVERWVQKGAPTLGEDNQRVLAGILGLSAEALAGFDNGHVIGTRPTGC
jgi:crotonobetainyl-CoA:carnitine CoA-transferase CaiB-like acyl-CoA transferase